MKNLPEIGHPYPVKFGALLVQYATTLGDIQQKTAAFAFL